MLLLQFLRKGLPKIIKIQKADPKKDKSLTSLKESTLKVFTKILTEFYSFESHSPGRSDIRTTDYQKVIEVAGLSTIVHKCKG